MWFLKQAWHIVGLFIHLKIRIKHVEPYKAGCPEVCTGIFTSEPVRIPLGCRPSQHLTVGSVIRSKLTQRKSFSPSHPGIGRE